MSTEATQPDHPARPFIVERQREAQDNLVTAFRETARRGQTAPMSQEAMELEARLIIATLDGIELEWLLHPEIDLQGSVRHYMNTVIARLTARPLAEVETETADWLASVQR